MAAILPKNRALVFSTTSKIVFAAMEEAIPRACNIMADWGADVTWLENTGYGDTVRDAKNAAQAERRNCAPSL